MDRTGRRARIGVVGVGNMGGGMAARWLETGWAVMVRDVRPEAEAPLAAAGARVAPSARALAAEATLVVIVVVDAEQIADVLFHPQTGAAAALGPAHTVVLCSTIAPRSAADVAARLADTGAQVLDAPISGGPARARAGTLTIMAAGADAAFGAAQPALEATAAKLVRVGREPGQGASMKLVNNLLAAVNLAAGAEAFALGLEAGLDPRTMLDVVSASSGQSWIVDDRYARVLAGDTAPRAELRILAKDIGLAVEMAQGLRLATPLARETLQRFREAARAGFAEADDSALFEHVRRTR